MEGRGCHAARHGLGLALWKETEDLRVVAAYLGHADLRSTMIYTQPLPEDVGDALDATWQGRSAVLLPLLLAESKPERPVCPALSLDVVIALVDRVGPEGAEGGQRRQRDD